jgi:hypothetical protein
MAITKAMPTEWPKEAVFISNEHVNQISKKPSGTNMSFLLSTPATE